MRRAGSWGVLALLFLGAATAHAEEADEALLAPEEEPVVPPTEDTSIAEPPKEPEPTAPTGGTPIDLQADEAPATARAPGKKAPKRPPKAREGFQMDIRTGARFPAGSASGAPGDSLGARYAWQVPLTVGLGFKLSPHLYLGGYIGGARGSLGSDQRTRRACRHGGGCRATAAELGAQLSYSFSPAARWNPWISYGLGWEQVIQSLSTDASDFRGYVEETTTQGFTLAKLGVGIDHRARVGIGPFAEAAVGQYYANKTLLGDGTLTKEIDKTALHVWITLGARLVIAP
ncbi:MAG: hypothetical protein KIT72_17930 [Polyangiaceae bacterium]|nr:hypothetical protein [Polyangiaceae bacterium]MCW5792295.1 hypothetical protein [Polyangiaceae bacterium]